MARYVRNVHDHAESMHTCPRCPQSHDNGEYLKWHLEFEHQSGNDPKKHSEKPKTIFKCQHLGCDPFFSCHRGHKHHIYIHHFGIGPIQCTASDCSKTFILKDRQLQHISDIHHPRLRKGGISKKFCTIVECPAIYLSESERHKHLKGIHDIAL
ncbi:hypothetical protein MRB53_039580 [Persea americana]|nr:hypothetical protein MRB53_039580 [Persea americana]